MLSGSAPAVVTIEQLLTQFAVAAGRQRLTLAAQLRLRRPELSQLQDWAERMGTELARFDPCGDDWAAGSLIQLFLECGDSECIAAWHGSHRQGWLSATSAAGLDYGPLQRALAEQCFELADRLTAELLRQLAGTPAVGRGYVYFSEVAAMPATDLQSLDRLWVCYSQGRFGFSVQARLLRSCGGRWDRLWPRIGWKKEGVWTRYPGAFTWSLDAPEGHMPLINQLRGVRLMDALLHHPALQQRLVPSAAAA